MLQVSVSRRQLVIFTAVIALCVSVAWVGVANQARAGSATPVVYVATGENFPDALGAGPAAAIVKGPILLVAQNSIPGETAAELTRLAPDKIIIVGGTTVVSASVESGLAAYAGTVERIGGANRYDTAAQLSAATYPASIDADTLDGLDSTAFLEKAGYDADANGVVDSAEVKIRHTIEDYSLDLGGAGPYMYVCPTAPLTLDTETTIIASASLYLQADATHTGDNPYVHFQMSSDGGATWDYFGGLGSRSAFPPGVGDSMSISLDGVEPLPAGTYAFSLRISNLENLQAGNDYYQGCMLTIEAYTGQGASTDVVIVNNT